MNFKKTVKDKKIWVREEELQNIPAILKKEYQLLQQSVQNDDICGALFRLKDIYEICIKLPSILSIITISARMERDRAFVRMPETQLKKEQEDFLTGREVPESDSEQQEKFRYILSHMVKEPLSIGNWRQITSSIVENAGIFALDKDLKEILEKVEAMKVAQAKPEVPEEPVVDIDAKEEITFDDFGKMQFQVGEIIACEEVKKSRKLLCSQVKIGSQVKQIVSGIKGHYTAEEMVGKKVMVLVNLKPAKLAGVLSEGMLLCAEDADGNLSLMVPEKKMPAGAEIC